MRPATLSGCPAWCSTAPPDHPGTLEVLPGPGATEEGRNELIANPDEITHFVCCRDPEWRVAFCGAEEDKVNPAAENFCTMCVEVALSRVPDLFQREHSLCPMDLQPCPDAHDVELEILRRGSGGGPPPEG